MASELNAAPNIKVVYQKLISQYLELLKQVASNQVNHITRQMIEDHIRIRMQEILKAFTIVEYKSVPLNSENDLAWLRQEIEFLTSMSGQLANLEPFQQKILSLVWKTLVLLFLGAIVLKTGSTDQASDPNFWIENFWDIIKTMFLSPSWFILLIIGGIFMLVADVLTKVKLSYLAPGSKEGINTYILEDQLFQLLGRKKPQDTPWDVWAFSFAGLFFSAGLFVLINEIIVSFAPNTLNANYQKIMLYLIPFSLFIIFGAETIHRLRRKR